METALATFQKGIDLLQPGDTLTIAPGEYLQSAHREKLGSKEKDTTIRAQIPGTVLLRGDVPLQPFKRVDGYRFVYASTCEKPVQAVNEIDTLMILQRVPTISELDAAPNRFFYDVESKVLYISASDWKPATMHHYTASLGEVDGLYFVNAQRLIIDGLAFTGFNNTRGGQYHPAYRTRYVGATSFWGLLIVDSHACIVRQCTAYLNGAGIGIETTKKPEQLGVGNLVTHCVAYGNYSQIDPYQGSAIGVYQSNNDEIRDCYTYKNNGFGSRFYIQNHAGGKMTGTISWGNLVNGNPGDIHIKTGLGVTVDRSVALGFAQLHGVSNSIIPISHGPGGEEPVSDDNIVLKPDNAAAVDMDREFADPMNMDFHLQSDSSFRGKSTGGKDAGPNPYIPNIFYVSNHGDDKADGLNVRQAWKTLARATSNLKPGDTLYMLPGTYKESLSLRATGKSEAPISIRGRGNQPVVIQGEVDISSSCRVLLQRINFSDEVAIKQSSDIVLDQCQFTDSSKSLVATNSTDLSITHCTFVRFKRSAITLEKDFAVTIQSNLFDNKHGTAIKTDNAKAIAYSDYNSYTDADDAWEVAGKRVSWSELQKDHDGYSQQIKADADVKRGVVTLNNALAFAVGGALAKPFGTYRDELRSNALNLVEGPLVHSVSATTANLEWMTTLPTICEFAWGDTPECRNVERMDVNYVGSFSLTGLTPGKKYYFKLLAMTVPPSIATGIEPMVLQSKPIAFATLKTNAAPMTYYVAPDGNNSNQGIDRKQAWKTIQHAADVVNVGDTVLVAAGNYQERVRLRATGDADQPITFRCVTGEKPCMDGAGKSLSNAFVIVGKSYLRFDGFYFRDSNMFPDSGFITGRSGDFNIYHSSFIDISRCMSDGRGGYSAPFMVAAHSNNLHLKNTININKMGSPIYINRSADLRIENSVFACPMIESFVIDNTGEQKVSFKNNIFTDMLEKKSVQNFVWAEIEDYKSLQLKNNSFLVRSFPPDQRKVFADVDHAKHQHRSLLTIGEFDATVSATDSVFADPDFAAVKWMINSGAKPLSFTPDLLMEPSIRLDFNSYFTTNPELIKRGIGLEPEAFKDFQFAPMMPIKK